MVVPAAAGQRFYCVAESIWMTDVASILKKEFRRARLQNLDSRSC